jgi:hypothetical protein
MVNILKAAFKQMESQQRKLSGVQDKGDSQPGIFLIVSSAKSVAVFWA